MLRYVGGGGFLVGVPARDLTEDEVKGGGWDRGEMVGSGLYVDESANERVSQSASQRVSEIPIQPREKKRSRGVRGQAQGQPVQE